MEQSIFIAMCQVNIARRPIAGTLGGITEQQVGRQECTQQTILVVQPPN